MNRDEEHHPRDPSPPASPHQEIFQRIRLLIQIRWFSAVGILAIVLQEALLKAAVPSVIGRASGIFATVVILNLIYAGPAVRLLQRRERLSASSLWAFLVVQLVIDVVLLAAAIHFSGGIDSDYKFLMILTPLVAALVIPPAGVAWVATCSIASYFLVLYLEYRGMLAHHVLAHHGSVERFRNLSYVIADLGILFGLLAVCCGIVVYLNLRLQRSTRILRLSRREISYLKDRYRQLIEQAQDAIFLVDGDASLRLSNRRGEQLLENVTGTTRGIALDELLRPEDRPRFLAHIAEALAGRTGSETARGFEAKTQRAKNGSGPFTLLFSLAPVSSEPGTTEILCIARDITEQRRLESQQIISEKMAAMGILAAGLSHEFSNLLASIRGYAQLAQQDISDTSLIATALQVIEEQTTRGKDFIERLNRFSFPQRGRREVVDLGGLLEEVFDLIRNQLENEHIDVIVRITSPVLVFGDKGALQHVFLNLAVNARHAILPKGKGTICVEVRSTPSEAVVEFSDTGVGMTPEEALHAFEPFFTTKGASASQPRTEKEGVPTGLGLSLAYAILEAHGGSIRLESQPGEGTTFSIRLPTVSHDTQERETEPAAAPREVLADRHVLIAVEEPEVARLLEELVRSRGGSPHAVARAAAILETLDRRSYDLLFLQESLPGVDIEELLYEIRRSCPYVKVVLMCDIAPGEEKASRLVRAGAAAVVIKPLHLPELEKAFSC